MFDIDCIWHKKKKIKTFNCIWHENKNKQVMFNNKTTKIIHSEYLDNKECFEHPVHWDSLKRCL